MSVTSDSTRSAFNSFCSSSQESPSTSFRLEARLYLSRQFQTLVSDKDLPLPTNALGIKSPVGLILLIIRLSVPFSYIIATTFLLQTLFTCEQFVSLSPTVTSFLLQPPPPTTIVWKFLNRIIISWSVVEVVFDIFQRIRFRWLQSISPIETSLSAAPIMEKHERTALWLKMMNQAEEDDGYLPSFITGWFFDMDGLEDLTVYDVMDWITWSMFEGRNQEHLTDEEKVYVKEFVLDLEWRLSFHFYGEIKDNREEMTMMTEYGEDGGLRWSKYNEKRNLTSIVGQTLQLENDNVENEIDLDADEEWNDNLHKRVKPRKEFHFRESKAEETPFLNLYEALQKTFIKTKSDTSNRLHKLRSYVNQKHQITRAVASNAYENIASRVSNFTVSDGENVEEGGGGRGAAGGGVLKSLAMTLSNATYHQLEELWGSVCGMKERLELKRQLKGYRNALSGMINMNAGVHAPTRHMADILTNITNCEDRLIKVEQAALMAFWNATAASKLLARKVRKEHYTPQRYARYSSDPLLGHSARYPLGFHLAMYGLTDGILRVIMKKKGFKRMKIASTCYYYHPGVGSEHYDSDDNIDGTDYSGGKTPIVFCHGIGIGPIHYESLIDELLKLQRPVFLPEIPYVSGFRPWMSRHAVLTPPAVTSTLTAMLATHGHVQACFVGHSYGTSWLSYMCKYAPHAVASVVFLDPICFCLHDSKLTKSFVYQQNDPGSTSSMVMTDLNVIWTIQRNFPWARIVLFLDDIPSVPWRVYLSEKDYLVPVKTVEKYFKNKGVPIADYRVGGECDVFKVRKGTGGSLDSSDCSSYGGAGSTNNGVFMFQGKDHGDWSEDELSAVHIANNVRILMEQYESSEDNR